MLAALSTSVPLSAIVLIVAILLFLFMAIKGTHLIIAASCAIFVVAFAVPGGYFNAIFTTATDIAKGQFGGLLFVGSTGIFMACALNDCGCIDTISRVIVDKFGAKVALPLIYFLTMLLCWCGCSPQFIIVFLSFGLMKQLNLPRYIAMTLMCGSMAIGMLVLPGSVSPGGLLPGMYLGTTVYAGAGLGLFSAILESILIGVWTWYLIRKARKNGEGYTPSPTEAMAPAIRGAEDSPRFVLSVIPLLACIIIVPVCILGLGLDSTIGVCLGQMASGFLAIILCHKYNHQEDKFKAYNQNLMMIYPILVGVGLVTAFGTLVGQTPCFTALTNAVFAMNIHPYIIILVGVSVTAAICADGFAGLAAFLGMFGDKLVANGVNVAVIHRLGLITATGFDSMPHNGNVCLSLQLFGYEIKDGYKYIVMPQIVIPMIGAVCTAILAVVMG